STSVRVESKAQFGSEAGASNSGSGRGIAALIGIAGLVSLATVWAPTVRGGVGLIWACCTVAFGRAACTVAPVWARRAAALARECCTGAVFGGCTALVWTRWVVAPVWGCCTVEPF